MPLLPTEPVPLPPDSAEAAGASVGRVQVEGVRGSLERDGAEVEQATTFRRCPRAPAAAVTTGAVAAIPWLSVDHRAAGAAGAESAGSALAALSARHNV